MASDTVVVGRFGKCHGLQGWLKVYSFTEPVDNILSYQPWYVRKNGLLTELKLSAKRGNAITQLLVQPEDCLTPEQARSYVGLDIIIQREQLAELPLGEYYWADLQGLTVKNTENEVLGYIDYIYETGSNDVLVVKNEKTYREYWIPYLFEQVVLDVDLSNKIVRVDWPSSTA